jgi:hypothetical protein
MDSGWYWLRYNASEISLTSLALQRVRAVVREEVSSSFAITDSREREKERDRDREREETWQDTESTIRDVLTHEESMTTQPDKGHGQRTQLVSLLLRGKCDIGYEASMHFLNH